MRWGEFTQIGTWHKCFRTSTLGLQPLACPLQPRLQQAQQAQAWQARARRAQQARSQQARSQQAQQAQVQAPLAGPLAPWPPGPQAPGPRTPWGPRPPDLLGRPQGRPRPSLAQQVITQQGITQGQQGTFLSSRHQGLLKINHHTIMAIRQFTMGRPSPPLTYITGA